MELFLHIISLVGRYRESGRYRERERKEENTLETGQEMQ